MPRPRARFTVFLLVFGLAGCDSPSPAFRPYAAQQVSVDGATFSVRHSLFAAEAIRISRGGISGRAQVVERGAAAILRASGCRLVPGTVEGDAAIVRADLDCGGGARSRSVRPDPVELDCGLIPGLWGGSWQDATIECVVLR